MLICIWVLATANAQTADTLDRHWPTYISLDQYMQPFLEADTIYDEVIMPIREEGALPEGRLLFPAKKILFVRDAYLGEEHRENVDWTWQGQRIMLTDASRIPFFSVQDLIFPQEKKGTSLPSKVAGNYVLFSEGELLRERQLAITYIPLRSKEDAGLRLGTTKRLPRAKKNLRTGKPMHVVFFGNSIETGANSSGFQHKPPFMPNWAELFIYRLRKHFGGTVTYRNLAVGGKTAAWGVENIAEVAAEKPDLVVLGFGMNDGTMNVHPDTFVNQINEMINRLKQFNGDCEFIVITPMLANPQAIHSQIQADYRMPLWKLEKKGVAIADLTYWHQWLLTRKSYQDMTGNNINHPNDYLARWYAQVLTALLIENR